MIYTLCRNFRIRPHKAFKWFKLGHTWHFKWLIWFPEIEDYPRPSGIDLPVNCIYLRIPQNPSLGEIFDLSYSINSFINLT